VSEIADFRSDTVTQPTGSMRRAMAAATVGDDVHGDDPTVRALEERVAGMLGTDASLFVPSGVMGNLVALMVHARPGDEILLEENAHSFHFETGGAAAVAGVQTRTIPSDRGIPSLGALEDALRSEDIHFPRTRVIVYENTNNMSGGTIVPLEVMKEIGRLARSRDVRVHLDGARLWHAHVATGVPLDAFAGEADSVMCCLSKALSAPVGSLLAGERAFIHEARRMRKRLGGGMRQAGVLAAAGLVALDEQIGPLAEDHRRARRLAETLAEIPSVILDPSRVLTNIVILRLAGVSPAYEELIAFLDERGVRAMNLWGRGIRFVTHRMIDDRDVERAADAMLSAHHVGLLG
jgi:threonine aldolase